MNTKNSIRLFWIKATQIHIVIDVLERHLSIYLLTYLSIEFERPIHLRIYAWFHCKVLNLRKKINKSLNGHFLKKKVIVSVEIASQNSTQ